MKSVILAITSILLGSVGQVLLKVGMNRVGKITLSQLSEKLLVIFMTPSIIVGLFCFVMSSLLWMVVISGSQLSNTYPMVSLGYVFVFILSIMLFQESVNIYKIGGLLVIIVGVLLMGKG